MEKKFIITKDKSTADKLIAAGFKLITNISGTWTFENQAPKNFSFADVDKTKFTYTNILAL